MELPAWASAAVKSNDSDAGYYRMTETPEEEELISLGNSRFRIHFLNGKLLQHSRTTGPIRSMLRRYPKTSR